MRAVDRGLRITGKRLKDCPAIERTGDARSHALSVLANDDSALQWSAVGTGLTGDLAKTFRRLYERYVERYDQSTRTGVRGKAGPDN